MVANDDLKLFISEVEDLLQKLEGEILTLEENPTQNKPFEQLFFYFHSLKGITAMAGFENVSKFCHVFETYLNKAKEKNIPTKKSEEFVGMLFESLEVLRNVLIRVKEGDMTDINGEIFNEIKESLDEIEKDFEVSFIKKALAPEKMNKILEKNENNCYKIYIVLQSTCVFKKVRLFIIFRALNKIGHYCWSIPSPERLEIGDLENQFEVYYISNKNKKEISRSLDAILEIENVVITKMAPDEFQNLIIDYNKKSYRDKQIEIRRNAKKEGTWEEEIFDGEKGGVGQVIDEVPLEIDKITTIKVNVERLEGLMNYFGELVIIKNKINQILYKRQDRELINLINSMDKPFLDIQENIYRLRLVRVESMFKKYKRLVRDIAKETGKKIKFTLEGTNVEIDRKILEELNSPLIHLLRNAVYHGIELPRVREIKNKDQIGSLKLKSYRSAGSVYIEVSDDGKGIDYDAIRQKIIELNYCDPEEAMQLKNNDLNQYLLLPGFSTLSKADLFSGRGMGLSIVTETIKKLGGSLEIFSEKDKGIKFTLIVPFSRAILKAQLLKVAGDLFAIPIENINQIYFYNPNQVEKIDGINYYKLNSSFIPIIYLSEYFKFIHKFQDKLESDSPFKVAIWCKNNHGDSLMFIANEVIQQMDVVVKPFKSSYTDVRDILGSTITGDGSICLIIDVLNIISAHIIKGIFQLSEIT